MSTFLVQSPALYLVGLHRHWPLGLGRQTIFVASLQKYMGKMGSQRRPSTV